MSRSHFAPAVSTRPGHAAWAWPLIAVVGLATFVVAVVDAGLRNPGYRPLWEAIDGLGAQNATDPIVMKVAFLALAVATVAAGIALLRTLRSTPGVAAAVIVVIVGLAEAVLAFVRQDCSTARAGCSYAELSNNLSTAHSVHRILVVGLALTLIVALWMLAAGLRRDAQTDVLARLTLGVAVASTAVFVWFGSELYGGIGGAVEKTLIALVYGWPVLVAVALSRQPSAARPTAPWFKRG